MASRRGSNRSGKRGDETGPYEKSSEVGDRQEAAYRSRRNAKHTSSRNTRPASLTRLITYKEIFQNHILASKKENPLVLLSLFYVSPFMNSFMPASVY